MNISGFDKQEKPKRKDEESSSKKGSVLEERKRRRSNSQSLLPPRKSRRREGIDRSRSPLRHYLSDVSSDKELTDNRKYGPKKCEVCHCEMQMAANFLSHVLSAAHISKCLAGVNTKKRRFTLELDYLPLRKEIEHARRRHLESPPKPSQKGSRPPPSRKRDSRSRSPPYNKSAN
ncbi:Protein CBG09964 [Caenorhabditis briggsae]|nr:Protein CBG09964 [Caenorhabditis briggsae]CAP29487.4 Protein CBG09964 [Caenorhabditis briggsae]